MKDSIIKYIKHFKTLFIVFAVICLLYAAVMGIFSGRASKNYYPSTNSMRATDERVFDFADVLTDKEEDKLRKLIAKREKQTCCDIVIVTLDQSLADYEVEYREAYPYHVSAYDYVGVFADKFWEDMDFGYDEPLSTTGLPDSGDGVILVDNRYEEFIPRSERDPDASKDTAQCTWFGTQGIAEEAYSEEMIDHLLDVVYEKIDSNPYQAYKDYVNTFTYDMLGSNRAALPHHSSVPFGVALVVSLIYILPRLKSKKGTVTTKATTYLIDEKAHFPVNEDIFLRKSVTKTQHVSSSGGGGGSHGGGGGHHSSGGGGSHGGGGHHR